MPNPDAIQLVTAIQFPEVKRASILLLDTRPAERFAALHIKGSIQISLEGNFSSWAAILIDSAQKLLLIAENSNRAREAQNRLARVGLKHVIGYFLADENQWRASGLELASISIERCEQFDRTLQTDYSLQLVDVRSQAEWLKGHLPGATSMPLLDIDHKKTVIDPSRPTLVYCYEGYRATTAASILLRESKAKVSILIDGVEGWLALGLPLERA